MKNSNNSTETKKNFNSLISSLTENEILNTEAMSYIRGGEGEDNGGEVIILIPKG